MYKILFIGAIRENQLALGGEEYKNQLILSKLKKERVEFTYIDSLNWKKSPVVCYRLLINLLFKSFDRVIVSASSVSTYRLLYFLYKIRPNLLVKTTYLVIGGYFPEAIINGVFKDKIYKKLRNIIVEGEILKCKLVNYFDKSMIKVIPNFKAFPELVFPVVQKRDTFRFVFVGRISVAKGVALILEASEKLKLQNLGFDFVVDFYGPLEEQFDFKEGLEYKGYLDFSGAADQSYTKLSEYNCFLFPTMWKGEGFPGVILDAYIAGLPVIASDWNMNTEIIEEGINGFIIAPNDIRALEEKMKFVMSHNELLQNIRINNMKKANEYHIDRVWPELFKYVV
jgi:glycosyltransferase involved in cell wall biosynthesis